jgi:hypothetical protein
MPYLVVHFTNDNSYTVINDINNKLKSVSKATVNIDEKWQTGNIIYRAKTEALCEKWSRNAKELNESSYSPTDDETCRFELTSGFKYFIISIKF